MEEFSKDEFERRGFVYDRVSKTYSSEKEHKLVLKKLGNIPFPILNFKGNFCADYNHLSFKNFPINVDGQLYLSTKHENLLDLPTEHISEWLQIHTIDNVCNLKSLKSNIKSVKRLDLSDVKTLESLEGLENILMQNLVLRSIHKLTSLKYCPKLEDLSVINCSIKDLSGIDQITRIMISNCPSLTSLFGLTKYVKEIRILNCPNLPTIEADFATQITAGKRLDQEYHLELLKFIVSAKRESEIENVIWPENFLNNELIHSVSGISKFNL